MDPGENVVCVVELDLKEQLNAQSTVTFVHKDAIVRGQRCEAIQRPGFGGPFTIRFLGVGKSVNSYNERIESFISALETDTLFSSYRGLFSLTKAVYPVPTLPSTMGEIGILSLPVQKYCEPAHITIVIGENIDKNSNAETTGVPAFYGGGIRFFVKGSNDFFQLVTRHELGHLLGLLADEYETQNSGLRTSCTAMTPIVENNRVVCPAWKQYPDDVACVRGCMNDMLFRSTEDNIMRHKSNIGTARRQFSAVHCAYLKEQLENLKQAAATITPSDIPAFSLRRPPIDFARGMEVCLQNKAVYNLITQSAAPA